MRITSLVLLPFVLGACAVPEPVPPGIPQPRAGQAEWGVAPGTVLEDDTVDFIALVTERACAGGRSSEGRVVGPAIEYTEDAVIVTFGVRPLAGAQECPGNPATRVLVTLEEPLAGRQLLDGGYDPPRQPPVCQRFDICT